MINIYGRCVCWIVVFVFVGAGFCNLCYVFQFSLRPSTTPHRPKWNESESLATCSVRLEPTPLSSLSITISRSRILTAIQIHNQLWLDRLSESALNLIGNWTVKKTGLGPMKLDGEPWASADSCYRRCDWLGPNRSIAIGAPKNRVWFRRCCPAADSHRFVLPRNSYREMW